MALEVKVEVQWGGKRQSFFWVDSSPTETYSCGTLSSLSSPTPDGESVDATSCPPDIDIALLGDNYIRETAFNAIHRQSAGHCSSSLPKRLRRHRYRDQPKLSSADQLKRRLNYVAPLDRELQNRRSLQKQIKKERDERGELSAMSRESLAEARESLAEADTVFERLYRNKPRPKGWRHQNKSGDPCLHISIRTPSPIRGTSPGRCHFQTKMQLSNNDAVDKAVGNPRAKSRPSYIPKPRTPRTPRPALTLSTSERESSAAILIQSLWRRRASMLAWERTTQAVKTIQSFLRHRSFFRRDMLVNNCTIVSMASNGNDRGTHVEVWHSTMSSAECVLLPDHYDSPRSNGYAMSAFSMSITPSAEERNYLAMEKKRTTVSAVVLQAWCRSQIVRRDYNLLLRRIAILQACCRGFSLRKIVRVKGEAAIRIQSKVRSNLGRENYIKDRSRKVAMSTTIQKNVRGHAARLSVAPKLEAVKRLRAALSLLIPRHVLHLRQQLERHRSITIVQSRWRCYIARKHYCTSMYSARVIQSFLRKQNSKEKPPQSGSKAKDIMQLPSQMITYADRMIRYILLTDYPRTAMSTKNTTTSTTAETKEEDSTCLMKRQGTAAVGIQKAYRGWSCRKENLLLRLSKERIQADRCCGEPSLDISAVIRLQAVARGLSARRQLLVVRRSLTALQALSRGRSVRSKYHLVPTLPLRLSKVQQALMEEKSATTIQGLWRGCVVRKRYHVGSKEQNGDATAGPIKGTAAEDSVVLFRMGSAKVPCVEQATRCLLLTDVPSDEMHLVLREQRTKQRKASTVMQSWWRSMHRRNKYVMLKAATITIQRSMRAFVSMQRQRDAATPLSPSYSSLSQSAGFDVHGAFDPSDPVIVARHSASAVDNYSWEYDSVSNFRREACFWDDQQRGHFSQRQLSGIILIQSLWRMHGIRSGFVGKRDAAKSKRLREAENVTKLQCNWRAYAARRRYRRAIRSCRMIQAVSRGRKVRSRSLTALNRRQTTKHGDYDDDPPTRTNNNDMNRSMMMPSSAASAAHDHYMASGGSRSNSVTRSNSMFSLSSLAGNAMRCIIPLDVDDGIRLRGRRAITAGPDSDVSVAAMSARKEESRRQSAAVTIQSRGRTLCRRVQWKVRQRACIRVQAIVRRYLVRREQRRNHDFTRKIQSLLRGYHVRSKLEKDKSKTDPMQEVQDETTGAVFEVLEATEGGIEAAPTFTFLEDLKFGKDQEDVGFELLEGTETVTTTTTATTSTTMGKSHRVTTNKMDIPDWTMAATLLGVWLSITANQGVERITQDGEIDRKTNQRSFNGGT